MAKSIRYVRDYEIDVIEYEILSTNTLVYAHEDRDDDASPIMKGAHESRIVNKARFLRSFRIGGYPTNVSTGASTRYATSLNESSSRDFFLLFLSLSLFLAFPRGEKTRGKREERGSRPQQVIINRFV